MSSLSEQRRLLNRQMIACRITEHQAQRAAQRLYASEPHAAPALYDPGNVYPGFFVPHDEASLGNPHYGAQEPQRRTRRPW